MAKTTKNTKATEATATATAAQPVLAAAISGTLVLGSVEVEEGGNPVETKTLTIWKGKVSDATRYQAACDGTTGKVAATITAAINDLLENGLKVLPKAWAVPKNEKEVAFPEKGDNKPKEPESIDDLSPEMADGMRAGMETLSLAVADYADARNRTFASVRKVATQVRDLRTQYTKAEWTIFGKLAAPNSEVAKLLTAKNTLGEFVFFANIPEVLVEVMPEGKKSPKAAQAWINGLRGTLAHAIVDTIKLPANAEAFATLSATEAVRKVVTDHYDGEHTLSFDAEGDAINRLLTIHVDGWPDGGLFDVASDGTFAPARDDGKHITASQFGSEGADELVKALAGAFNSYKTPEARAAVADMKARTKAVVSADFTKLSPDAAALHIFNILAARVDGSTEESLEGTTADCLTIVDKLGGWFDAIAAGTMTVADVLASGPKPESEEDAEGEGDADA